MKSVFFIFYFLIPILVLSQNKDGLGYSTDFENDWSFIEFDPPVNNIWQVGTPSKDFLDSAYNGQLAIMTDTINLIDSILEHSFIMKLERPVWSNAIFEWSLTFFQKCSFDNISSGGYIEVSYDKGLTWINVVNDNYLNNEGAILRLYSKNDTLINGTPAMTGEYIWNPPYISFVGHGYRCSYEEAALVYSVWVRITYENLRNGNPHEGWLIDKLSFSIRHWCEYLNIDEYKSNNVIIYPNPASDILNIEIPQELANECKIDLINTQGIVSRDIIVKQEVLSTTNLTKINIKDLGSGLYYLRFISGEKLVLKKIVVE